MTVESRVQLTAWTPRIAVDPETLRKYLTWNIHYWLDPEYLVAVVRFYALAEEHGVLPAYRLRLL